MCRRPFLSGGFLAAIAALAVAGSGEAQRSPARNAAAGLLPGQLAERGPRFLLASDAAPVPLEAARTPLLRQRVTLDLDGLSTRDALMTIARTAGLELMYADEIVPAGGHVRLRAERITVAAALTDVLLDAGLDVVFTRWGSATLVRRADIKTPPLVGTITGHVIDEEAKAPIPLAQVVVVGTNIGARTGNDGVYILRNVNPGSVRLRVTRVGYAPATQTVDVPEGGQVTADFTLATTTVKLDEVVTTATGDQERRQVGNVIGTIRADSVAQLAPTTQVAEMLSGRVAGVQVINTAGATGTAPMVRIRGVNSLSLGNDPLLIVDGIRADNGAVPPTLMFWPQSRFTDFTGDDIESIDVIKGPSATALYGTAAANGVLIIKTKRGSGGRTSWNVWTEQGLVQQPVKYFDNFRSWGHALDAGQEVGDVGQCRISDAAAGACKIDSLTRFNPLNNPATTPFHDGNRWKYGAQASGGVAAFSYYLMGEGEDERGPYEMPASEQRRLTQLNGVAPTEDQIHPNHLRQYNGRANFTANIGQAGNVTISSAYLDRALTVPMDAGYFAGVTFQGTQAPGYRTPFGGYSNQYIGDILSVRVPSSDQRFTSSASANWAPLSWLATHATTGIDQTNTYATIYEPPGEGTDGGWGFLLSKEGGKQLTRANSIKYSTELGASSSWQARPTVGFKTSVGAQYFKDGKYYTWNEGYGLPPGATTVSSASNRSINENTTENSTYGAYLQEDANWRERLYLSGGLRRDKNSSFGVKQGTALYPRASLSWVASDESFFPKNRLLTNLRLRSSWGKAAVQPPTTAALQYFYAFTAATPQGEIPALYLAQPGNPVLKPETTSEIEFGGDVGFFNNRVSVEATYFRKDSKDALLYVPLPASVSAGYGQYVNLGKVRNEGPELTVDAELLKTPLLSWSTRLNGSHLKNKVISLGGQPPTQYGVERTAAGYPIGALFARAIQSYKDANGDHILTPDEIVVADSQSFVGGTIPEYEAALTNTFGLFNKRITVTTQFDYRGHFYNEWNMEQNRCTGGLNCRGINDPTAPLREQAAAVAAAQYHTNWGYVVRNDFIRFRELSVAYSLPPSLTTRYLHGRSSNLVLTGRNIGILWTKYPGPDPEANGFSGSYGGHGNYDWFSPPVLHYWMVRLNLGL